MACNQSVSIQICMHPGGVSAIGAARCGPIIHEWQHDVVFWIDILIAEAAHLRIASNCSFPSSHFFALPAILYQIPSALLLRISPGIFFAFQLRSCSLSCSGLPLLLPPKSQYPFVPLAPLVGWPKTKKKKNPLIKHE